MKSRGDFAVFIIVILVLSSKRTSSVPRPSRRLNLKKKIVE